MKRALLRLKKSPVFRSVLCVLSVLIAHSNVAFGWADMGHQIVGAIAEANLKPATHDYIRGLMGVEPLEVSAIFPDHVRDDDRFGHHAAGVATQDDENNFDDYHFCEIPVGYTYSNKPNKFTKDCHGAILGAIATLKNANVKRAEKMIALRYLIHVMGDIHQPLHVGNTFDHGGNSCQIKYQLSATDAPAAGNLHAYWDDTLVVELGRSYADPSVGRKAAIYLSDYMTNIKRGHPDLFTEAAKKAAVLDLDSILAESAALRENGVYPDDPAVIAQAPKGQEYKSRPYCLWYPDSGNQPGAGSTIHKDKIPVLGPAYAAKFAPIAEMQLIKGGLRLANTLDEIAAVVADQPHAQISDSVQEKIIDAIQSQMKNQ